MAQVLAKPLLPKFCGRSGHREAPPGRGLGRWLWESSPVTPASPWTTVLEGGLTGAVGELGPLLPKPRRALGRGNVQTGAAAHDGLGT